MDTDIGGLPLPLFCRDAWNSSSKPISSSRFTSIIESKGAEEKLADSLDGKFDGGRGVRVRRTAGRKASERGEAVKDDKDWDVIIGGRDASEEGGIPDHMSPLEAVMDMEERGSNRMVLLREAGAIIIMEGREGIDRWVVVVDATTDEGSAICMTEGCE